MGLVSQSIPHLFNGVSQQAVQLRLPTQAEAADNVYPDVAVGTRKRSPTVHIAKLNSLTDENAFTHLIDRDASTRHQLVISGGALYVYDAFTGAAMTVSTPSGTAYLAAANPRETFVALTVADYTFIVNRSVVTAMDPTATPGAVSGTVQQFSALPAAPPVGTIYRVEGTPDSGFDDYYVQWNGGVWVETTIPGSLFRFDAATMPWKLTKTGPTTFTFDKVTWADRLVGTDASNPHPSFIGQAINDVYFSRNRLGFLSGENLVLSRTGDPFNFYAETVTAVLDTDPIDYGVATNKVSILNWAVPFNRSLMLFSDRAQLQFSGGDILTPKTAKVDEVTGYQSVSKCRPLGMGNAMFFPVDLGESTGIREYYVDQDTVSNEAPDITAHVPTYVPKNTFKLSGCSGRDLMCALSLSARNTVYTYKFFWKSVDEKAQSAWTKWVFASTDVILGLEFVADVAYLVIKRADGMYLEKLTLAEVPDTALGLEVLLDRRVSLTGVYDAGNNWTTWTLPYVESGDMVVVRGAAFGANKAADVVTTRPTSSTIRATGDYSAGPCYVGRKYNQRYQFSEQYLRDSKGESVSNGKLMLKRMFLTYTNTGSFTVTVTPKNRDPYTYTFTRTVGATIVGSVFLRSGTFRFPIRTENLGCVIEVNNDSYLPCTLQNAKWEAEFTIKSARAQ